MTTDANPFQSPQVAVPVPDKNVTTSPVKRIAIGAQFLFWLLFYLYPVWLLSSFYVVWLIAWSQLGHTPRPMLDDPTSIGGPVSFAYYVSGEMIVLMPLMVPLGIAASFFCPLNRRSRLRHIIGGGLAMIYIAICGAAWMVLRWDPWRVVEWWFD